MPSGVVICELLIQTLSPDNASIRAAEHELVRYEREDPEFFKCLLHIITETWQDASRVHVGQAAAVCLKNAMSRDNTTSAAKHGIWEQIVPLLLSLSDRIIQRQLAECCKSLLEDVSLAQRFTEHLLVHVHERASIDTDSSAQPLVALLRCLKVLVRVCISTASQPAFRSLSCAVDRVLPELCNLLRKCNMYRRLEQQKAVLKVLLVVTSHQHTCGMMGPYIVTQREAATQWIACLESIICKPPDFSASAKELVLGWKSKARATQIWTFLTQHVLDLHDVARVVPFMDCFMDAYVKVLDSGLRQLDEPSVLSMTEDDDAGHAFQTFAVQILTCLSCDAVWRPDLRSKYLTANMERLLTTTLIRFLNVTSKDMELLDTNTDEYTMRSQEDFANALSCPHGCENSIDCHACNLRRVHHEYVPSTPRAAAMAALRELVHVGDGRVEFLSFLHEHLRVLQAPDTTEQGMAMQCGFIKAFAAAADLVVTVPLKSRSSEGAISICSDDFAYDAPMTDTQAAASVVIDPTTAPLVLRVVVTCLLPAMLTADDAVPLAAHLRCVVVTVVERFLVFLTEMGETGHALAALQGMVSLLVDAHTTVRRQALDAFRNAIQCRPLLKPLLHEIAPEVLSALIALLYHGDIYTRVEALAALTFMLYEFRGQLGHVDARAQDGAVGTVDGVPAKIFAHHNLLAQLVEQYCSLQREVLAAREDARAGRSAMTHPDAAERVLARYIEAIHAVIVSAPKTDAGGTLHMELVPLAIGFLTSMLTPAMMRMAALHNVDVDTLDIVDVLPLANDSVVAHVFSPMMALLAECPRMLDTLALPLGKFFLACGWQLLQDAALAQQLCDVVDHGFSQLHTVSCTANVLLCVAVATAIDPATGAVVSELPHAHRAEHVARMWAHGAAAVVHAMVRCVDATTVPTAVAVAPGMDAGSSPVGDTRALPRVVCALCGMLYIDPEATVAHLSAPGAGERGAGRGEAALVSLGLEAGLPLLADAPGVDGNLCLLGMANLLCWSVRREARVESSTFTARLVQGCFALATRLRHARRCSASSEPRHAAEGAAVRMNTDDSVGGVAWGDAGSSTCSDSDDDAPDVAAAVTRNGHDFLLDVVTFVCGCDPSNETHMHQLVGHEQWQELVGAQTTKQGSVASS
eukprot:m.1609509 g.1609509  ORF g.1609509 m.1609509 type:complete len:1147 (+) comp25365_c0_seq3:167-3607(+)